jgi:MFS family permease
MTAELRAGWQELRSRQWAWVVIGATSVALLVSFGPFLTLGPTVADENYGSTGVYGALTVALGAGTLIGSVAGLRWRPRYPIRFAMTWAALWAPVFALFAVGPPLWALVPLFVLVGFAFAMFDVSWDTAIAERIPPHAISRVSAFDWMGSLALLPLGYLLAGPLAASFGAEEVLVVGGLVGLGVALAGLAMPGVWRLRRIKVPAA